MPSSELKYCHFIPGLDFRLSASTAEGRDKVGEWGILKTSGQDILERDREKGGIRIRKEKIGAGKGRREGEKTDG